MRHRQVASRCSLRHGSPPWRGCLGGDAVGVDCRDTGNRVAETHVEVFSFLSAETLDERILVAVKRKPVGTNELRTYLRRVRCTSHQVGSKQLFIFQRLKSCSLLDRVKMSHGWSPFDTI